MAQPLTLEPSWGGPPVHPIPFFHAEPFPPSWLSFPSHSLQHVHHPVPRVHVPPRALFLHPPRPLRPLPAAVGALPPLAVCASRLWAAAPPTVCMGLRLRYESNHVWGVSRWFLDLPRFEGQCREKGGEEWGRGVLYVRMTTAGHSLIYSCPH